MTAAEIFQSLLHVAGLALVFGAGIPLLFSLGMRCMTGDPIRCLLYTSDAADE